MSNSQWYPLLIYLSGSEEDRKKETTPSDKRFKGYQSKSDMPLYQ